MFYIEQSSPPGRAPRWVKPTWACEDGYSTLDHALQVINREKPKGSMAYIYRIVEVGRVKVHDVAETVTWKVVNE